MQTIKVLIVIGTYDRNTNSKWIDRYPFKCIYCWWKVTIQPIIKMNKSIKLPYMIIICFILVWYEIVRLMQIKLKITCCIACSAAITVMLLCSGVVAYLKCFNFAVWPNVWSNPFDVMCYSSINACRCPTACTKRYDAHHFYRTRIRSSSL